MPTPKCIVAAAVIAAAATLSLGAAAAAQALEGLDHLLASRFGLTPAERKTLAGGFEAVRALPSAAPDGVAAIGAIRIAARPETYLQWAAAFADFERGSSVQAVQKLSSPPAAADFTALTLSREELRELERCRIGSCAIQLDAPRIRDVRAIDWRRADAASRATDAVRAMMLDAARGYAGSGIAGLPHYHDSTRATDVAANFQALIDEEAAAGRAPAPLLEAIRSHPASLPSPAVSYLYWTTNTFGLKPTTRLNHTIVYRGGEDGLAGVIATKQLYATHYFHGGLDMRYIVANPAIDDRFVLVMVTRTRSDGLTGVTGAVIGGTVRRRALTSLRAYLRYTKEAVEKRERAAGRPTTRPGAR